MRNTLFTVAVGGILAGCANMPPSSDAAVPVMPGATTTYLASGSLVAKPECAHPVITAIPDSLHLSSPVAKFETSIADVGDKWLVSVVIVTEQGQHLADSDSARLLVATGCRPSS